MAGLSGVGDNRNSSAGVMTGSRVCGAIDSSLFQTNERFPFHLMPTLVDSIVMRPKEQVHWMQVLSAVLWRPQFGVMGCLSIMLAADSQLTTDCYCSVESGAVPSCQWDGTFPCIYVASSIYHTIYTEQSHGEGINHRAFRQNPPYCKTCCGWAVIFSR